MTRGAVVLVVLLLSTPLALASWRAAGEQEPSTAHDRNDGWMFADPDTSDARRVYFQGFASNIPTETNTNVALVQGGTRSPAWNLPVAYFGVWKDCNADGYIGFGEQALFEYRQELLRGSTICPRESTTVTR